MTAFFKGSPEKFFKICLQQKYIIMKTKYFTKLFNMGYCLGFMLTVLGRKTDPAWSVLKILLTNFCVKDSHLEAFVWRTCINVFQDPDSDLEDFLLGTLDAEEGVSNSYKIYLL